MLGTVSVVRYGMNGTTIVVKARLTRSVPSDCRVHFTRVTVERTLPIHIKRAISLVRPVNAIQIQYVPSSAYRTAYIEALLRVRLQTLALEFYKCNPNTTRTGRRVPDGVYVIFTEPLNRLQYPFSIRYVS